MLFFKASRSADWKLNNSILSSGSLAGNSTQEVSYELCCSPGHRSFPFSIPVSTQDVLETLESFARYAYFHLVCVYDETQGLEDGADGKFQQFVSSHGWGDYRLFDWTRDTIEDISCFQAARRHVIHDVVSAGHYCHLGIIHIHLVVKFDGPVGV